MAAICMQFLLQSETVNYSNALMLCFLCIAWLPFVSKSHESVSVITALLWFLKKEKLVEPRKRPFLCIDAFLHGSLSYWKARHQKKP